MSQFARITNIDVLRDFRAALASFAEDAGLGLSEAQSDVQRTIWWISQDRQAHWRREHKKRTEKLNQAKAELFKKQLESNDTRTSAVVERKNVAKAEAALHEAESKLQAIKRWSSHLEREFMLFKAACGQVSGAVQADVPAAATTLDRRIDALQAYIALQTPSSHQRQAVAPDEPPAPQTASEVENTRAKETS